MVVTEVGPSMVSHASFSFHPKCALRHPSIFNVHDSISKITKVSMVAPWEVFIVREEVPIPKTWPISGGGKQRGSKNRT